MTLRPFIMAVHALFVILSFSLAKPKWHAQRHLTLRQSRLTTSRSSTPTPWCQTQYGLLESGKLQKGQVAINIDGFTFDLGTLGGMNSWDNPFGGEINDRGEAVGYSETNIPDPNGEDICGFGTGLTCRPFLWQSFHMRALPTLGGNNGQASAMNNRGQITGFAENGNVDSTCPTGAINNRIALPVLWEKGRAHALPTVGSDSDG